VFELTRDTCSRPLAPPVAYAQKISEGRAKFRHNRVTSQINFRGSAEGTTILGGPGAWACEGMLPGKFCKITPKNVHSGRKF